MYAPLLFLLSFLLQLQYDNSQRVGDVAVRLLERWRDTAAHQCKQQDVKLDRMMPRRGKPPTPEDESLSA